MEDKPDFMYGLPEMEVVSTKMVPSTDTVIWKFYETICSEAEWQEKTKVEVDWDSYRGNNHNRIPYPGFSLGGMVSLPRYIGKPLSYALWRDLVARLGIETMSIYRPNEERWCLGRGPGYCQIELDEDDFVKDIKITTKGRIK